MDTAGVAARRDGHRISRGKAGTMSENTATMLKTIEDIARFKASVERCGFGNASNQDVLNILVLLDRVARVVANQSK
jgi:stage III sporulation protein SpoIIIAA